MRRGAVVAILAALAACSPEGGAPPDKPAAAAAAQAQGERYFDRETFTIVYTMSGVQTGSQTEHVRDWGKTRAMLQDYEVNILGQKSAVKGRSVFEGAKIYNINDNTGEVSLLDNPIYDQVVQASKGTSGVDFSKAIMRRMGAAETGDTGRFAGHACAYWTLMGARTCVSDWGATLHTVTELGGVRIEQTAVEVRLGDGGPDSAFAVERRNVTGPSRDVSGALQQSRAQN